MYRSTRHWIVLPFLLAWLNVATSSAQEPKTFDPEAATRAYLDRIPDEEKEQSDAYFEGGYWLQLVGYLYGLGVAWILLAGGISARMRDWAERWRGRGVMGTALYAVQYIVVSFVFGFPLTVYQGYFREHQYGLATQTFGHWLRDQLVGLLFGLLFGTIALTLLYLAIRKAGSRWWVWGAAGGLVFLCVVMLVAPVFIAPAFNTYTALEDASVKDPILSMARANGVPATEVFQFDASRQSKRISANVSGFLATTRISLNDNLLNRCSLPEIKAVMAHEIGHYALNHVYENIVFFGVLLLGGMAFLAWSFEKVRRRWGERFGVTDIGDVAGLPLLAALLATLFFVLTPLTNTYIRANEVEADIFGLNAAREPDGFAEVSLKLAEYRKMDPGPIEEFVFFDHPSGRARIHMAMVWKAEQLRRAGAPQEDTMEGDAATDNVGGGSSTISR
jgi:STE24 endopeptidase